MLELRHLSKSYGPVRALTDLSLEFRAGEIHGLIGENGAGKSTAIKIATGLLAPDAGEVWLDGRRVSSVESRASQIREIGFVHQEIAILPDASVAENIMIDKLVTRRWGTVDWSATEAAARQHMMRVGLDVPPRRLARELSAAQKQLVQIAKALSANVKVLLLDEPTSSLTEHEAGRLFGLLRELRAKGAAIIFVSHKLEEVMALCDRVNVMRDGCFVGRRETSATSARELVQLMLGRTANDDHLGELAPDWRTEMLRAHEVIRRGKCRGASFTLFRGEVLGFYGLVGSGRTELARILIGEEPMDSGQVFIRGQAVAVSGVEDCLYRHRCGYVTENRKEEGVLLHDTIETNLTISIWPRLRRWSGFGLDRRAGAATADRLISSLSIKAPHRETTVGHLSGGNQQKVSIGKWLAADCDILIVDEPTVGVDIGAKQQIHRLIWELAAHERKSVIVISSDLPELVRLANRILVFREQQIVAEVRDIDTKKKTYAEVSREIAGVFVGSGPTQPGQQARSEVPNR